LLGFIPFHSGCSKKEWKEAMEKFNHGNQDGALYQMEYTFPCGFEMLSYDREKLE